MKHSDVSEAILKAYADGQLATNQVADAEEHIRSCEACRSDLIVVSQRAAEVCNSLDQLPQSLYTAESAVTATAWAAFLQQRDLESVAEQTGWSRWRAWSLAGGLLAAVMIGLFTLAPVRAWAETFLALFRVEHFTVLEINPAMARDLTHNPVLNQALTHVFSDQVTITQSPQKPQRVADAASASKLAGFAVKLLANKTPAALVLQSGARAQMKLDSERLQSILNEAGRSDLRLPASVDGAVIGVRIPAGIFAFYGNCGNAVSAALGDNSKPEPADATCISLTELPSPVVSAPREIDPGQMAQIALQFLGMSANDAASFTQTVDWTSTLVLPVFPGQSTYNKVPINGNEGVLLRSKRPAEAGRFMLMWVEDGIVHGLNGTGDDTTAVNLASQLD